MKVCVLFSGGKDSMFALMKAKESGNEISCLVTIKAKSQDSYMYHLPNIHLTEKLAEALDLPIFIVESSGEKEKELTELKEILADLKRDLKIEGVVSGAIASSYQKERVDKICSDLGLKSIAPLWHRNQKELLEEMLESGLKVMLVGTFAAGFDEKWLGKILDKKVLLELLEIEKKFKINLSGEGGEFESLVLDCPLFSKELKVIEAEKEIKGLKGELKIKKAELAEK